MRIAYDAAPLLRGEKSGVGIWEASAVLSLSRAYPKDRFSLLYFALRAPGRKRGALAPYLRENVELSPCSFYTGRWYRATYGLLPLPFSMFFPRRADVTHFFDFLIPPGVRGKCVVTVPDIGYLHYPRSVTPTKRLLLKWNMRKSLSRADRVITASEYMRDALVEYYGIPAEKVRVICPSVDRTRFHENPDPAKTAHIREKYGLPQRYILYMGALEPRKNLSRLLDAYADLVVRLKEELPVLVLAGRRGFGHENLERKVARMGLSERVIFCGYVAERDKPFVFSGACLFAFPSLFEGFGVPVLEAMSCGVPVLTSRVGALPELYEGAAYFVEPNSVSDIREGLYRLLTQPALCETLREQGLSRAQDTAFSRAENAERLHRLYRELCE